MVRDRVEPRPLRETSETFDHRRHLFPQSALATEGRGLLSASAVLADNVRQIGGEIRGPVSIGFPPSLSLMPSPPQGARRVVERYARAHGVGLMLSIMRNFSATVRNAKSVPAFTEKVKAARIFSRSRPPPGRRRAYTLPKQVSMVSKN